MIRIMCLDRTPNVSKMVEVRYVSDENDVALRLQDISADLFKAAVVMRDNTIQVWVLSQDKHPQMVSSVFIE